MKCGVTTMFAIFGTSELFTAVNEAISPDPVIGRPMLVLSLLQVKVVVPPELVEVKLMAGVAAPLQTIRSPGLLTWAAGLTVTMKV